MENEKELASLIKAGIKSITFEGKMCETFIKKEINGEEFNEEFQEEYINRCNETTKIVVELLEKIGSYGYENIETLIKPYTSGEDGILVANLTNRIKHIIRTAILNKTKIPEILYNKINSVSGEYEVILYNLVTEYIKNTPNLSFNLRKSYISDLSKFMISSCPITEKFKGDEKSYILLSSPALSNSQLALFSQIKKNNQARLERHLKTITKPDFEQMFFISNYLGVEIDSFVAFTMAATFIQSERYGIQLELGEYKLGPGATFFLDKAKTIYEQYNCDKKESPKIKKITLL